MQVYDHGNQNEHGNQRNTVVQACFVPPWIYETDELNMREGWLYVYLLVCAKRKDHCFPSQDTMARRTKMSVSSVKTYLASLEQKGFLEIKRNKYSNTYFFKKHPEIPAISDSQNLAISRFSDSQNQLQIAKNPAPDSQDLATKTSIKNIKYPPTPQRTDSRTEVKARVGGGDFSNCKFFGKGTELKQNTQNNPKKTTRDLSTDFAQKSAQAFEEIWQAYPKKTNYVRTLNLWRDLTVTLSPEKAQAFKNRVLRAVEHETNHNPTWLANLEQGRWIKTLENWLKEEYWRIVPEAEKELKKQITPTKIEEPDWSKAVPMPDFMRKKFNIGVVTC